MHGVLRVIQLFVWEEHYRRAPPAYVEGVAPNNMDSTWYDTGTFNFLRDHEQMDSVVQMPSHLFASLYRAAKREASKQVFSLQREYIGMSSQKLESLLQTYTFFLCPVKHQDPPSIPARHPDLPCQGYVPSSFCLSSFVLFLPTPTMDTHPIRPSTYA